MAYMYIIHQSKTKIFLYFMINYLSNIHIHYTLYIQLLDVFEVNLNLKSLYLKNIRFNS